MFRDCWLKLEFQIKLELVAGRVADVCVKDAGAASNDEATR